MGLGNRRENNSFPRLLIILNRFVIGGQAADTLPLAYYLQKDFDILIIYGEKEVDEIEPSFLLDKYPGLRLKKIKQLRRSINPFIDVVGFLKLLAVIIKFKPALVHSHGAKTGILGRLAAFICRVPVIVHTFHGHFFHSYFSVSVSTLVAAVERVMAKITTAVVALSETQKNDLVDTFKIVPAEKVQIIPLGFDLQYINEASEQRETFRNKYGLTDDVIAIGIVGRIVPVKNHRLFLEVAIRMLTENAEVPLAFFIVGDGELKSTTERYLFERNINFSTGKYSSECKIVFTSWITSMEAIMSGLDILALTSLNEGTPLTLIEAQYFQKPVVCTNVGGVKDTIENKKTGFLVERGNVDEFVSKLKMLVSDPALRSTMGSAGRELVISRFAKQNEVKISRDFYFSLLQRKNIN